MDGGATTKRHRGFDGDSQSGKRIQVSNFYDRSPFHTEPQDVPVLSALPSNGQWEYTLSTDEANFFEPNWWNNGVDSGNAAVPEADASLTMTTTSAEGLLPMNFSREICYGMVSLAQREPTTVLYIDAPTSSPTSRFS